MHAVAEAFETRGDLAALRLEPTFLRNQESVSDGTYPVLPDGATILVIGTFRSAAASSSITRTKCAPSFSTTGALGCAVACISMPVWIR